MTNNSQSVPQTPVFSDDLVDAVCFCNAGLAQDAPYPPQHYLNVVLNILFAYLGPNQRAEVEEFLAEKKYFPPIDLALPHNAKVSNSIS